MSTQVEIIESNQATIEVIEPAIPLVVETTNDIQATVTVEQASISSAIEVAVPGPQGPIRPLDEVRIDTSFPLTIYIGHADNGIIESESKWIITRIIYTLSGVKISKQVASNVSWIDRVDHTYT